MHARGPPSLRKGSKVLRYRHHPSLSVFRKDVCTFRIISTLNEMPIYIYSSLAKRAVTRQSPVCDEVIPVRLLGAHLELELHRVDEIIKNTDSSALLDESG